MGPRLRRVGRWLAASLLVHALLLVALSRAGLWPDRLLAPKSAAALLGFVEIEARGPGRGPEAPAPTAATDSKPSPAVKPKRAPRVGAPPPSAAIGPVIASGAATGNPGDTDGDGLIDPATGAATDGNGLLGDGGGGDLGFAPRGAQIGLQINTDRIRHSSLVLETEALMRIIPAWRDLLRGSGLHSFEDLSRILVATPDLDRASIVLAGTLRSGERVVRDAVARLAHRRQRRAPFAPRHGLAVAPWYGPDDAERAVVLLGRDRFAITRVTDVERVVEVLRTLDARTPFASDATSGASELSGDEALVLFVEDVRRFAAVADPALPRSLRLAITPIDEFYASVDVRARYTSPADAETGRSAIDLARTSLVDHAKIAELGLRSLVEEIDLAWKDREVHASARITLHQLRTLLAFARHALRPRGDASMATATDARPDPGGE